MPNVENFCYDSLVMTFGYFYGEIVYLLTWAGLYFLKYKTVIIGKT